MHQQGRVVTSVYINDVGVSPFCPERGFAVPATKFSYITLAHAARLTRIADDACLIRWTDGCHPREQVLSTHAVVGELHAGQCAMPVHRVDHQGQTLDVVVVPQPRLRFR